MSKKEIVEIVSVSAFIMAIVGMLCAALWMTAIIQGNV
jgi:hypothetical protein